MVDAAVRHFGGLDILINNAGIGATRHFMDSDPDILRKIETNFSAPPRRRVFLPLLKQGVTPAIVNISSVVGKRAWPARSYYSSSKFAVAGLWSIRARRLAKDGIDVIVVSPGLTQPTSPRTCWSRRPSCNSITCGMSSEDVALAVLHAGPGGGADVTLTFKGRLIVIVNRLIPWFIDWKAKKTIRKLFAEELPNAEEAAEQAASATSS